MGSLGKATNSATGSSNSELTLSRDLIEKANAAGMFVDYGDATEREYNKNVNEIKSLTLSDTEKQEALIELHRLTEEQLKAEAKSLSPYSMGVGPARINKTKMDKNANKSVVARDNTNNFMNKLRSEEKTRAKAKKDKAISDAYANAIKNKALSFTVDGKTFTRKTTRSKTFTSN